jgi:hypothetical protein
VLELIEILGDEASGATLESSRTGHDKYRDEYQCAEESGYRRDYIVAEQLQEVAG